MLCLVSKYKKTNAEAEWYCESQFNLILLSLSVALLMLFVLLFYVNFVHNIVQVCLLSFRMKALTADIRLAVKSILHLNHSLTPAANYTQKGKANFNGI